jgi:hypothetical protein
MGDKVQGRVARSSIREDRRSGEELKLKQLAALADEKGV